MAVIPVARNTRGSLIIYEQADIQTPATGASPGMKAHLISSNIAFDQPLEESKVINDTRNPTTQYQTGASVKGGFSIQADPIGLGYYLKWIMGAPVTTGAGPYTHVFKVNATSVLLALTVERFLADIAQAFRATGVKLNKFNFDIGRGQCLELPFDVMGLDEVNGVTVLDSAPYEPAKHKFLAGQINLQEAGVAFPLCKKFSSSFDNEMEGLDVLGNSNQLYDIIEGIGRPTGTFTAYLANAALWTKGKSVVETSLKLSMTCTDGTSTCEFLWPENYLMAFSPEIKGGTGAIPIDIAFKAFKDNAAEGTALQVTLVNSHPSYATIPA